MKLTGNQMRLRTTYTYTIGRVKASLLNETFIYIKIEHLNNPHYKSKVEKSIPTVCPAGHLSFISVKINPDIKKFLQLKFL